MPDQRKLFPGNLNLDRLQYEVANEIGVDAQKLRNVQQQAQIPPAPAKRQAKPSPRANQEDTWR